MLQYYSALKNNTLFKGFTQEEYLELCDFLGIYVNKYKKHDYIRTGNKKVTIMGLVIKGLVYLTNDDYHGRHTIVNEIIEGQSFGESLAFANAEGNPVDVSAAQDSIVMFIPTDKLDSLKTLSCDYHMRLTTNLLKLLSEKIIMLQIKNDILSKKNTREKLWQYLCYESKLAGSSSFKIHFSREELADFLSLNASSMSRELGKMRDEGILTFHKNSFSLKRLKV